VKKKTKTARAARPRSAREKIVYSKCRALIPLNTAAIRAKELARCDASIARYVVAEAALRQYLEHDELAFTSWLYVALGALHTELRAAQEAAHAAHVRYHLARMPAGVPHSIMDEMEDMMFGKVRCAEAGVHNEAGATDAGTAAYDDDDGWAGVDEEAAAREEFVEEQALVYGKNAAEVVRRVKELYRGLCRALHPDAGGALPPDMAWIWQEIQAAYRDHSVEDLFVLETRVMILQRGHAAATGISELKEFVFRIEHALATVVGKTNMLVRAPAWQFSTWDAAKKKRVVKRAERKLRDAIVQTQAVVRHYDQQSAEVARRPRRCREQEEESQGCSAEEFCRHDERAKRPVYRRGKRKQTGTEPEQHQSEVIFAG
jgi:hypothetical protein